MKLKPFLLVLGAVLKSLCSCAFTSNIVEGQFNSLAEVRDAIGWERLYGSLQCGCQWLTETSQVLTVEMPPNCINSKNYDYSNWQGSFRGEYPDSESKFSFFGPVWHGGQAIKALVLAAASPAPPDGEKGPVDQWIASGELGAGFIMDKQLTDGPDAGLILAYENDGTSAQTSTALEGMDSLFLLSNFTANSSYADAAVRAASWYLNQAWIRGKGLLYDNYDVANRTWLKTVGNRKTGEVGRPLVDDAIFLKTWQHTKNDSFYTAFTEVINTLMRNEFPPGNWIDYMPSDPGVGTNHPRQAFWWGRPFLNLYQVTGDVEHLNVARRSCQWYQYAQRTDGGMFRDTRISGDTSLLSSLYSGLTWVLEQQFLKAKDSNMLNAVLEDSNSPKNSDVTPYHLRDIATSFTVQAIAELLTAANQETGK